MTIKHDISDRSVVTTCTRCPYWQAFSFDVDEAHRREVNHNISVHDMVPSRARARIAVAAKRRDTPSEGEMLRVSGTSQPWESSDGTSIGSTPSAQLPTS